MNGTKKGKGREFYDKGLTLIYNPILRNLNAPTCLQSRYCRRSHVTASDSLLIKQKCLSSPSSIVVN